MHEHEEIRAGIERGDTITQIAVDLGRPRPTISAEVNRNGGRHSYRATGAQEQTECQRRRPKGCVLQGDPVLAAHVEGRLRAKNSPAVISAELAKGCYPKVGLREGRRVGSSW